MSIYSRTHPHPTWGNTRHTTTRPDGSRVTVAHLRASHAASLATARLYRLALPTCPTQPERTAVALFARGWIGMATDARRSTGPGFWPRLPG